MIFDKPITIEKLNLDTDEWSTLFKLHAHVNKTGGNEFQGSGAQRSKATRTFQVRYFKSLEEICLNTQLYRIIYREHAYNVVDYDDYMEQHKTVKLIGEAC